MNRTSGVLMPITALPSPWGVGTLGDAARAFLDFLVAGGQTYWQILPIGPNSYGESPYQAFSSYAGNPYFIDLDDLCREGPLIPEIYLNLDCGSPGRSDYGCLYELRSPVFRWVVERL